MTVVKTFDDLLLHSIFLKIIKLLPAPAYCKDHNGHYLFCNRMFAETHQLTNEEIAGKTDYDIFPQEKADINATNDLNVINSSTPVVLDENDHISLKIPLLNDADESLGLINISISIKEQIDRNIKTLDDIIAEIPCNVYWKDIHGFMLGCNNQQAKNIGLESRADIIGKTNYDITRNDDEKKRKEIADTITKADREVIDSGQLKTVEESITKPDGTVVVYLSEKKPLYDDEGNIIGLLGISIDITERKQLEEQLQKASHLAEAANQLKTEFIQNMQHDIRTPISGIWSFLNDMAHSDNLERFRQTVPFAEKAAQQLLNLCNEVIDFENVEYGDKPIYSHKFSLIDLAHAVIHLNSVAAMVHDTTLVLDIAADVPDVIKGDDYRLRKILINLVGNAVKFTEHGQVTLKIQCLLSVERKVSLRFSVIDTGIGISPEQIEKAFEKFTRLNPSNTGKFKGSGLGLHIVKKFAAEIDADLDVVSDIGKGSTFSFDVTFELPVSNWLADESAPHPEAARQLTIALADEVEKSAPLVTTAPTIAPIADKITSPRKDLPTLQIAFIEDDDLACIGTQNCFAKITRPCKLHIARNVAEALTLLSQRRFDMVISDIGLPDGTGFDICFAVKQNATHINQATPFVALTAHSDDAKRERAKEVGFLAVYNKPLEPNIAEKILDDFLPAASQPTKLETNVVDLALTMGMVGNNIDTVHHMLQTLVNTFAVEKPSYLLAFSRNDFTQARALFHKLRGGLTYIRVPTLEHIASALHEDIKTCEQQHGNLADLQAKLDDLCAAVDAIAAWLEKHHAT